MSSMDDAGLKIVAYFNRQGDTEGQRLFYLYTVEVEKQLKEKQLLTITRSELPKHGNSIMDKKVRNAKVKQVLEMHHVSEANARWAAQRALVMLRAMEPQERAEYARDNTFLNTLAVGYRIKGDHVDLFKQIVQKGVNDVSITGGR